MRAEESIHHVAAATSAPGGTQRTVDGSRRPPPGGGEVVGHVDFHGPPWMVGRADIGYSIFAARRRRGYATEAAQALVDWAFTQDQAQVFASVMPTNTASLRVVEKLGFAQVGEQIDDEDGLELVFAKDAPPA